jgi:hypothetical protein
MKMKVKLLKENLVVGTIICILLFTTFVGAISSTKTSINTNDKELVDIDFTHTILGEFGTYSTAEPCKYAHSALKELFSEDYYPFYYVTHVFDKNIHASYRIKDELGLVASPTVFWDGGFRVDVGAGSHQQAKDGYIESLEACGNRTVAGLDLTVDVDWLGAVNPRPDNGATNVSVQGGISWTVSEMKINMNVDNNDASSYLKHLHVYVCDINSSMGWYDTADYPYTMVFLDYAFNQNIYINAGNTWNGSKNWDGLDYHNGTHYFENITQDNTIVIASVFNPDTNYSDETIGFRAGVGTDPKQYTVYFGDTTPPPKILDNVTLNYFIFESGLEFDTTYYWKVDVWNALGNVTEGEIWSFTTRDNNPPNVPSDPYPENGSINSSICGNLSWTGGDPDGDNVTYDVYFGEIPDDLEMVADDINVTWYQLPFSLDFETSYVWKIVAEDEYGLNTSSPLWIFTTEENLPPNKASHPFPKDGELAVPVTANISWTGSDPNLCDTLTYDVYFGLTNPPTKKQSNISNEFYNPPGELDLYQEYYWYIVTWDSQGEKAVGDIWTFRTGCPGHPDTPTITGPQKGTAGENYWYNFSTTCPEGQNVSYKIQWGDGVETDWIGWFPSGMKITRNHTWNEKDNYIIKCKAMTNYFVESDWGTLEVSMPKNQQTSNMWFLRWLERFPILQKILDVLRLNN